MTGELELSVLREPRPDGGPDGASPVGTIRSLSVTDELLVAAAGSEIVASSNARRFEVRHPPDDRSVRAALATSDALWICGDRGLLAVSRDLGATWSTLDSGTDAALHALALSPEGHVWVAGDEGIAARVTAQRPAVIERIELETKARILSIHAIREEIVLVGSDGLLHRWRDGDAISIATGATRLSALTHTRSGTWIAVGAGGFLARSPDGAWYSRVKLSRAVDLEAIAAASDGTLVAVGEAGAVFVSTDDGRSWRAMQTGLGHLRTAVRFGEGVLVGGDGGLVAKLAPSGDATWSDRLDVFADERKPLDAVFADGPGKFIARHLDAYLAGIAVAASDEHDDHEPHTHDDEEAGDTDAAELLRQPGGAAVFERTFGVAMPPEAAHLFELDGAAVHGAFHELRLDRTVLPNVGERNLFELLVRHDQRAFMGTGLVEAFCGVFAVGSLDSGDSYHLELYEWDGPRQVLHYDHDDQAFTGVVADSLDSLVYLSSLERAAALHAISDETHAIGLRKLRGKVAPTWHFGIGDRDPAFVMLDAKRRDTEFLFYRSRWITALLRGSDSDDVEDIARLFNADFNQVLPDDQLAARFEACEKFNPTALYSMWRAYFFDEHELTRYLEIGRRHRARIVRDAAILIDELRGGRNELGAITDMRARVERFRALDLDPRRAEARKSEAEARARADALRTADVEAELARTPPTAWTDLAWRWLDDRIAHRVLLARLADRPSIAAELAAIDALGELGDDERELVLPRLARELSPELESILLGSLVRGDSLEGLLAKSASAEEEDDEPGEGDDEDDDADEPDDEDEVDEDDDEVSTAEGWNAIDAALDPIYRGEEPHAHFGTVVPYMLGGNDPLHGISVYLRDEPAPHFHFVTYGFTDLFTKETENPAISGFGFELSFRLARATTDREVPDWALVFLQNLARYVFGTGNQLEIGHKMGLGGPLEPGSETPIVALLFAADPELGELTSPFGRAHFIEAVGITEDEYRLIQEWSTSGLVEILRERLPHLITDLHRSSVLDDPAVAADVQRRVAREGSSEDLSFAGEMPIVVERSKIRIEMGALYAAALPRAMRGRLRHGRDYTLRGRASELHLEAGDSRSHRMEGGTLTLTLTPSVIEEIETRLRGERAGTYRIESWPGLEIVVTPSIVRDNDGRAIAVRGVDEPDEVRNILAEENARLAMEQEALGEDEDEDLDEDDEDLDENDGDFDQDEEDDEDEVDDEDDDDEDDDEDLDDDDEDLEADEVDDDEAEDEDEHEHEHHDHDQEPPPSAKQVKAALAMTKRALRVAPNDDEAQYTHAMLLLDADRAGLQGAAEELVRALPRFTVSNRLNIVAHLGREAHSRFAEALDVVLRAGLPAHVLEETAPANVVEELFTELGDAVLEHAPGKLGRLIPVLPREVNLLSTLAWKALDAGQREQALALYERLLELPIPEDGDERMNYLRAMNNACVQAHAAQAYDTAVRIADRAQPVASENPYLFHAAACAYVAVGDDERALEMVRLAIEHDYEQLEQLEVDPDLGGLLTDPRFAALFAAWRGGAS